MLRAVIVGLLAVSGIACKSGGDSPKSQPGVAAGKVVEVSGTVTVRHNDVASPLAKGATVEGDDVIETGADGNVIIELSHNLARWELGANKKSKVNESTAWGLAKKSGDVANVEQDTAAAGRNAERSAADTSVSAESAPAQAAPAVGTAPPGAAAPAVGAAPPSAAAPAAEPAPPPPPPAPIRQREKKAAAPADVMDEPSGGGGALPKAAPKITTRGGSEGGGSTGTSVTARVTADSDKESAPAEKPMSPAEADKAATDLLLKNDRALKACLTKDAQAISLTIKIAANGAATAVVTAKAAVPAKVQSCIKAAVAKIKFAKSATTVSMEISR